MLRRSDSSYSPHTSSSSLLVSRPFARPRANGSTTGTGTKKKNRPEADPTRRPGARRDRSARRPGDSRRHARPPAPLRFVGPLNVRRLERSSQGLPSGAATRVTAGASRDPRLRPAETKRFLCALACQASDEAKQDSNLLPRLSGPLLCPIELLAPPLPARCDAVRGTLTVQAARGMTSRGAGSAAGSRSGENLRLRNRDEKKAPKTRVSGAFDFRLSICDSAGVFWDRPTEAEPGGRIGHALERDYSSLAVTAIRESLAPGEA